MYSIQSSDKPLFEQGLFTLQGLIKAHAERDHRLAEYVVKLVQLDPYPIQEGIQERSKTLILGHAEHGMSTVFKAIHDFLQKNRVGKDIVGGKSEETEQSQLHDIDNDTFIFQEGHKEHVLVDGTFHRRPSKVEDFKGVTSVVFVVSLADGVMPQLREMVRFVSEAQVPNVFVYGNKLDTYASSERAEMSELVGLEVKECFQEHGLQYDAQSVVFGSALLSLQNQEELGTSTIKTLVSSILAVEEANQVTVRNTLKKYAEFRSAYHLDAVKYDQYSPMAPSLSTIGRKSSHASIRRKKAQLFTERFNAFCSEHPKHVPERLKMGEFILWLYDQASTCDYSRQQLLLILQYVPLKWGPWQAYKYIMKRGLLDQQWDVFATVYSRWQDVSIGIRTGYGYRSALSDVWLPLDTIDLYERGRTRSWRARTNPNFAEITSETHVFLQKFFQDRLLNPQWSELSQKMKESVVTEVLLRVDSFEYSDLWYKWARSLTWTTNPKPLMRLWQQAKCGSVQDWAFALLQQKHASSLVDIDITWVVDNGTNPKTPFKVRNFIIDWICRPITNIEKSQFKNNGIHRVIFTFLDSKFNNTNQQIRFACDYIRQFMESLVEDIDLDRVLWMLRQNSSDIVALGEYLLFPDGEKKSPYAEMLDLEFWTDLLNHPKLSQQAQKQIKTKFRNNISLEWLKARLYSKSSLEVNLGKTFITEGIHTPGLDFYPVYYENIFAQVGKVSLYDWAWDKINKVDDVGDSLRLKHFTTNDFRKLLLSGYGNNAQVANDAFINQEVSTSDFPIDFLKHLIHQNEFSLQKWSTYIEGDVPNARLTSVTKNFATQQIKAHQSYTFQFLEELGVKWVLERRNGKYAWVSELFKRVYPNRLLVLLKDPSLNPADILDTPENNQKGVQTVLETLDRELHRNSRDAQFWKNLLFDRLERYRELKRKTDTLLPECLVSGDVFTLDWFVQQFDSKKSHHHIGFAREVAGLFLSDWIAKYEQTKPFGFATLRGFFNHSSQQLANYFFQVFEQSFLGQAPPHAAIDLESMSFIPEELYEYCYDSNSKIRQVGLRLIREMPERFAQPDKLVELTNSPDPKVRAMVVEIIYSIAHIPLVTSNWKPYEDSVVPGNSKRSFHDKRNRKIQVIAADPPRGASPSSTPKYIGAGTSSNIKPELNDRQALVTFALRQLFSLPEGFDNGTLPTWKLKCQLVETFRDLALQDRQFAILIVPVFQELTDYRGVRVREAVWSALAYIDAHYEVDPIQTLTVFQSLDSTKEAPNTTV